MGHLSCHLDESGARLICPIQSIVAISAEVNERPLLLEGALSCPIPSVLVTASSASSTVVTSTIHNHEQCSCEGIVPTSMFVTGDETDSEIDKGNVPNNDKTKNFSKCRCLVCEVSNSNQGATFAWECDQEIINGCWGFDCHGHCHTGPFSTSLLPNHLPNFLLDDTTILEPVPTNYLPPSLRSPSINTPLAPSPSGPPTTALAAQSASLLWIMSLLAVTHNSTDFWSSQSSTAFGFI